MIRLILIALIMGCVGCAGTYMNDVSVYVGVGRTVMDSPNCIDNGSGNPNIVGLAGIVINAWESESKLWKVEVSGDHGSCALADDAPQSDMVPAVKLSRKIWERKQ